MKTMNKFTIAVIVILGICTTITFGSDTENRRPKGGHHGPPPEAYTACEGKTAGDAAGFISPHGNTVTGTCEQQGDRLVLRPDNPPGKNSDGRASNRNRD
ncbi:MAG: hypothetical protein ABIJ59_20590 [Pseudomonadota bacterium]